jgi:hypothetical protein
LSLWGRLSLTFNLSSPEWIDVGQNRLGADLCEMLGP